MYRRRMKGWAKHYDFIIIDLCCLMAAFLLAFVARHGFVNPFHIPVYLELTIVFPLLQIAIVILFETFKNVLKRGYYLELLKTAKQVVLVELGAAFFLFLTQEGEVTSRSTLIMTGIFYAVLSYGTRVAWKLYLTKKMSRTAKRSLLIITTELALPQILKNVKNGVFIGYNIYGVVLMNSGKNKRETIDGIKLIPYTDQELEQLSHEWIDEVFLSIPVSEAFPEGIIDHFMEMGITVHTQLTRVFDMDCQKQYVEKFGGYPVLTSCLNVASTRDFIVKRAIDIVGALVGCSITLVLTVILGPIIFFTSPGPIFFKQTRVGENGKKFKLYKFRSMYMDAEERKKELTKKSVGDGVYMFKLEEDPRIIGSKFKNGKYKKGIGNFIRDLSLDEFPQFFNVLIGDMSLVGTRPPTEDEWNKYKFKHRARLAVKPGITGLWQVSGRSNITDFDKVVNLDRQYIANWNLSGDIKILLKTIEVVVKRQGAM